MSTARVYFDAELTTGLPRSLFGPDDIDPPFPPAYVVVMVPETARLEEEPNVDQPAKVLERIAAQVACKPADWSDSVYHESVRRLVRRGFAKVQSGAWPFTFQMSNGRGRLMVMKGEDKTTYFPPMWLHANAVIRSKTNRSEKVVKKVELGSTRATTMIHVVDRATGMTGVVPAPVVEEVYEPTGRSSRFD